MTEPIQHAESEGATGGPGPKPPWLKVRLGMGESVKRMRRLVHGEHLHTVCEEALCPNLGRCWEHGRATLMILGDTCSRNCRFCNVSSERPEGCDTDEPARVAKAVASMGLQDVVFTSVTRDDLADGGAAIWAETIRRTHEAVPGIIVEALTPDFGGDPSALNLVFTASPEVLSHNLETVPSLYPKVRPQADYRRSLRVLRRAVGAGLIAKTSLMLGVGESRDEVARVMRDALGVGCEIFYLGQYLQPTRQHLPVRRYVTPDEFDGYHDLGLELGFKVVVSAPLVRSSYHSGEQEAFVRSRTGTVSKDAAQR